jgi:hypothetical protein
MSEVAELTDPTQRQVRGRRERPTRVMSAAVCVKAVADPGAAGLPLAPGPTRDGWDRSG